MHTPLNFPDSPEGKRLLRAREEFRRVEGQIRQHIEEYRVKHSISEAVVYPMYADEGYIKMSKECESAKRAYYMATKDESQLGFSPIPRGQWNVFQKFVKKYFGKIAQDFNSKLVEILPWIYGFATERTVVILEAFELDRGIPPTFAVALRRRKLGERIEFSSEIVPRGISESWAGLESIVRFQNPNDWENRWKSNSDGLSDEALKNYAEILMEYGNSFLADQNADWAGLQKWLRQERERRLGMFPWLPQI